MEDPFGATFIISLCLLLFFTFFANAQTSGAISGKVTDTSNNPLSSVNVSLTPKVPGTPLEDASAKGTQKGAATNANGKFRIENVSPGSYTLRITAVGYVSQDVPVKVAAGQTLSLPTILLKSKSQRLGEVEVTGEGSLVPTKETEYVARMPLANIENPQVYNVVSSKRSAITTSRCKTSWYATPKTLTLAFRPVPYAAAGLSWMPP